jgi:putative ABC transport system permease protein
VKRPGSRMNPRYRPRPLYLWLALLTFLAVFAATAGARQTLASRTQAVRQTVAATSPTTRTITVSAAWHDVQSFVSFADNAGDPTTIVPSGTINAITSSLHAAFNRAPVRLTPAGTDWSAMTVPFHYINDDLPGTGSTPVKIEITERQPLGAHVRLLSGRLPVATPVPAPAASTGKAGDRHAAATVQGVMTRQTAARLGLHAGSEFVIRGSELASTGTVTDVTIQVTGIVAPVDPDSSFWGVDPGTLAARLQAEGTPPTQYWAAAVLAGPDESDELQSYFGSRNPRLEWVFPLDLSSLDDQQVQPLSDALDKIAAQTPTLSGPLEAVAALLTASSGMSFSLNLFIATAQSVDTLLWLLYVSLTVAALAVLLLAARMVAMRRSAEITVIRARGGSLRQIAVGTGRDAALLCVPAAVTAAILAIAVVPGAGSAQGAGSAGGWWPPITVVAVAVLGPALIAAWQHRLPRRRTAFSQVRRGGTRLVMEAALVAASVAGIVVSRDQGVQAGSGVNLFTSSAPVLVAIPAVIIMLRLYPLALRGLLRVFARSSRAPAFLGLARASRTGLTPALPALALVLALTVAAFAGMVRDAVAGGEVAASWRTAGADATVTSASTAQRFTISPAAARAVAAVPGVTNAAEVMNESWATRAGSQVSVLAVDPASYAELVARTSGFPPVPAGLLAVPGEAGAPQPVLASPQAAALLGAAGLGRGAVTLSAGQAALQPVRVRVAGVIASTPALPAGGAFVIMPLAAVHSATPTGLGPVNEMLLTGGSIDHARLTAVLRHALPGGVATFRSDILSALVGGPLQHGAFTLFALAVVVAAILGLAVMLLELALGAAEREATLARLATMGLAEGQRAWVVAVEVLPAVIAAAVAAWACALALPRVLAPDLDLSVFTGSSGTVKLAADIASFAVPLAGLAMLTAVALGIEIRSERRRGATSLRIGG